VNGKKIKTCILELPSFYGDGEKGKRSSFADMEKLLKKAKTEKIDGLLLISLEMVAVSLKTP